MAAPPPPNIFSQARRINARRRAYALQQKGDAPRYILEEMVADVLERLAFLRFKPATALIVGDWSGVLADNLSAAGCTVTQADPAALRGAATLDEERPYPFGPFELTVSLGTLGTVNDLPGGLIHLHNSLSKGGMAIASFPAAGSLQKLRKAMQIGDGDRPAPRIHPMVDVRAGGQLLQRAGFSRQVADSFTLKIRFGSMEALVRDLRAQGLGSVLVGAREAPALTRAKAARAAEAFRADSGPDGRVTETIELLTLSGWRD
jgi:hypothetical protein